MNMTLLPFHILANRMLEVKQAKTSAFLNQANMEQITLIMDIVHI